MIRVNDSNISKIQYEGKQIKRHKTTCKNIKYFILQTYAYVLILRQIKMLSSNRINQVLVQKADKARTPSFQCVRHRGSRVIEYWAAIVVPADRLG